jgi:cellulose biosynthesis protein BcsQ
MAQEQGVDVFAYDDSANGAKDYRALAREVQDRLEE